MTFKVNLFHRVFSRRLFLQHCFKFSFFMFHFNLMAVIPSLLHTYRPILVFVTLVQRYFIWLTCGSLITIYMYIYSVILIYCFIIIFRMDYCGCLDKRPDSHRG